MRYRWAVLGAGTLSQASFSAITVGLAVLAPVLRDEYSLSLGQIGALLSAAWLGSVVTLFPWGIAADRFGERAVLALGLTGAAVFLGAASRAGGFEQLFGLLVLAGASGSSVNSASGRAVMLWFAPSERGLALGIRQTAIPLGGLAAAVVLPQLAHRWGSAAGFLFLGGFCLVGAVVGAAIVRGRGESGGLADAPFRQTLANGRLWRLSLASGLYVYTQVAVIGFGVLFLHDRHGLTNGDAALVLAVSQALAIALRIGAGRWSDVAGSRVGPLRLVGLAVSGAMLLTAALAGGPIELLVPVLAVAGALSMSWNGLAFTAAAEIAGTARSGAAIGFQQAVLAAIGVAAPIVFARTVSSASWGIAFALSAALPVVGWLGLRPLSDV